MFGCCLFASAYYLGWVELLRHSDRTGIVEGISALAIIGCFGSLYSRKLAAWIASFLPLLGLLGTVIGFMLAFGGDINPETMTDPEGFKQLVAQMLSGLGTALSTTLVGIVAYIWLEVSLRCITK